MVAERSTCARLNVGAIITRDNRIVSMGWNGQPPGEHHCVGRECLGFHRPGTCGTIHAEDNALRYLPGPAEGLLAMYVTDSPCGDCAGMISGNGIDELFFARAYRDTTPLDFLARVGVKVFQVMPAGFILNWATKEIE